MKKLLVILMSLLLVGCSSNISVSNGDEKIITGDGSELTKQEFFESLRGNDYSQLIVNDLYMKLAELEGLDMKKIEDEVKKELDESKKQYGDDFDQMVAYYGGEENMIEVGKVNKIKEELNNKYFKDHKAGLVDEYKPIKAKIVYFDNQEKAQKALDEMKKGTSFEMAVANNGYTSTVADKVYTDKSDISIEVKNVLSSIEEPKLYDQVVKSTVSATDTTGNTTSSDRYYVIQVTETNVDKFEEEFFQTLSASFDANVVLDSYLTKYNVEVHDQRAFDLLSPKLKEFK